MSDKPSTDLRIVFFGTPDLAVPVFERLFAYGYVPVAVVTAPDQPVGRKKTLTPPPMKEAAALRSIPVFQPSTLKDPSFLEQFKALQPDLCVVVAYGKLIPKSYLELPKFGFLNVHPSALPEYRGPSPIQAAIMDGKAETTVSVMLLDEEMDHGPVIAARTTAIDPDAYYIEVAKNLFDQGARLLVEILPEWLAGSLKGKEQDHSKATFTKLLDREDGKIDWNQPVEAIYNKIRALSHEPGVWTTWNGKMIRIIAAKPSSVCPINNPQPGTVIHSPHTTAVMTGSCTLILEIIQVEGGTPLPIEDFVRGHADFTTAVLN